MEHLVRSAISIAEAKLRKTSVFKPAERTYASLRWSELRELRLLLEKTSTLKHLAADLTLDKHIRGEIEGDARPKSHLIARQQLVIGNSWFWGRMALFSVRECGYHTR